MSTGPGNQLVAPLGAFTQQAAAALLLGPAIPLTASGAIPQPPNAQGARLPGVYVITKAGVAALTLAAPVAGADDGVELLIFSTTAFAHTITTPAAGDIQDGNASGFNTVMTFNAHKGANCILRAYQGVWYVMQEIGCALSS
jgi:hypothetical protein